jgi:OOP family OmpA-OmpF porin
MFKPTVILKAALLGVALCSAPFAMAESIKAFGAAYVPVAAVSAVQAQVVYYRAEVMNPQPGAAHVYVDHEFHGGLLPGGYTAFCVTPGSHILSAYLDDAPSYRGKTTDVRPTTLEGGKTYFLRVNEGDHNASQWVSRVDAEQQLKGTRQQIQALSRASSVEACIAAK